MIVGGRRYLENEYHWVGGNFSTVNPDGSGGQFVNAFYQDETSMPPYLDGGWVSEREDSFEPFEVMMRFRVTGALFANGTVQYRRTASGVFRSFVLPNGAMTATIVTTSGTFFTVPDRLEYEAVPTGLGTVVNPNGTLSENLGRLSKSPDEVRLERDGISAGLDAVVAGRRYLFNIVDERFGTEIDRSVSVRTAVGRGLPQYSFIEGDFKDSVSLYGYETRLSGKIVSLARNRFNDFSENLRLLLVQDVQSKILSVQGDNVPTVIRELDGISSSFGRSAIQTPIGIMLISAQGVFAVEGDRAEMVSKIIDTFWKNKFNDVWISEQGDYPKDKISEPYLVQGFYDVEQNKLFVIRGVQSFVFDFQNKAWYQYTLSGVQATSLNSILPARVIRRTNESFVMTDIRFDNPERIDIYARDLLYKLNSRLTPSAVATTNLFVAPPNMEYHVLRVGLVLSGIATGTASSIKVQIIEGMLGSNYNFSITDGVVVDEFNVLVGDAISAQLREFDVPVRIGKNVRAFAVRVFLNDMRVVVEEINVWVMLRRRPVSRGVNPSDGIIISPD